MTALNFEPIWPDTTDTVGLADLALACAMRCEDVQELIEFGALMPLNSTDKEPVFSISCMAPLRTAEKVRSDYDLDLFVVVIVLDYLRRIEQLESQLSRLEASTRPADAL